MHCGITLTGLLFVWMPLWIYELCQGMDITESKIDERCKTKIDIAPNRINDSCQFLDNNDGDPTPCLINDAADEGEQMNECIRKECCWVAKQTSHVPVGCYEKPVRCYLDLRPEMCPEIKGIDLKQIYEGFSMNGSFCFVENVQPYFQDKYAAFNGAITRHGVRILGDGDRGKTCCRWSNPRTTEGVNGTCRVELPGGEAVTGVIWAKKCVLHYPSGGYRIYDLGSEQVCTCHLDAWLENKNGESLYVSDNIRSFVEKEEKRNRCTQILGRLVRHSWMNRLDIVNSAEAEVVVNALLNLTGEKTSEISAYDAKVLLNTSDQLKKYKFYEGIENDSAKFLIESCAKVMSNLMERFTVLDSNDDKTQELKRQKREVDPELDKSENDTSDLRWEIMSQLEGITDNAASQIRIGDDETYVVGVKEAAVNLQVAIAKPANNKSLYNVSHTIQTHSRTQRARVTSFAGLDGGSHDENVAVITVFYAKPEMSSVDSRRPTARDDIHRVSDVLAINLRVLSLGDVKRNLSLPVRFTLRHSADVCHGNSSTNSTCTPKTKCAFAEENTNGKQWSTVGCAIDHDRSDEDSTACVCNHTTHFAVLMQTTGTTGTTNNGTISQSDVRALELLSVSLGSISVAALAATTAVFVLYRKILLKDRMLIHMHLIVALMCGYVFFLCGSVFSQHHLNIPTGCFVSAVASHLFFLSTFFWFLVEGIYLFQKVVLVFSNKWAEGVARYSPVIGWLFPAVVVIISAATSTTMGQQGMDSYYSIDTCFLQPRNHMIWAFMGPALLIIMINSFVLARVLFVIYRSSLSSARKAKSSEEEQVSLALRNSAKGAVILLPILGIPWVANVFVNIGVTPGTGYNYAATVGAYVHVTLMGLQGVAVFIFYCVFNSEVRNAYKLSAARRKSMASIESHSKRKRSRAPLITSKNSSPDFGRYRTNTNQTIKTTELSLPYSSAPPSPGIKEVEPSLQYDDCVQGKDKS